MGDFVEAARVTVMGMGMVFATLGGLMLIIAGLQRVFRQPAPRRAAPPLMGSIPPLAVTPAVEEDEVPTEVVAAIAVALAVLRERQEVPDPPKTSVVTFAPGTSAWRATGRLS